MRTLSAKQLYSISSVSFTFRNKLFVTRRHHYVNIYDDPAYIVPSYRLSVRFTYIFTAHRFQTFTIDFRILRDNMPSKLRFRYNKLSKLCHIFIDISQNRQPHFHYRPYSNWMIKDAKLIFYVHCIANFQSTDLETYFTFSYSFSASVHAASQTKINVLNCRQKCSVCPHIFRIIPACRPVSHRLNL